MYQKFIAQGRVGKDPEFRNTQAGARIGSFSMAVSKYVKGEEKTTWFNVTCWNEHINKVLQERVKKGTLVLIEGEISFRKYEKEGREIQVTEVVLGTFNSVLQVSAGGKERAPSSDDGGYGVGSGGQTRGGAQSRPQYDPLDDGSDIPF